MDTKRRRLCPSCGIRLLYKLFRYVDHDNQLVMGVLCHACARAIPEVMIAEMEATQLLLMKKLAVMEATQIVLTSGVKDGGS